MATAVLRQGQQGQQTAEKVSAWRIERFRRFDLVKGHFVLSKGDYMDGECLRRQGCDRCTATWLLQRCFG